MAQSQATEIQFPPGRMVMGDLYTPKDKDAEGKPLTIKSGPDAGKPRVDYFIAVAIPKTGEPHWAHTPWGQKIWAAGHAAFPQQAQAPTFAWKIDDGDSQVPNRRGRKPCDNEGWRGHWVLKFGGGYAPKVFAQPSAGQYVEVTEKGAVKPGYWVIVSGSVTGNNSAQQPGVYLNHRGVLFVKPDAEIRTGPDAATMFAGAGVSAALPNATLPPGVHQAPAMPGAPAMPAMPGVPAAAPALPGAPAMPAMPAAPTTAATPALPATLPAVAVLPNPGILQPPAQPAQPATPTLTPAGLASGYTYQQYRDAGYTDDLLRQHGLIV